MRISGFTLIRNAILYDFPIVESISSLLPFVDEYVVNVGRSDDETLALVQSIASPKIKIIETVWDESLKADGKLFGLQQDVALAACTGDWAICLQGDEVVHEDDLPIIRQALETYLDQPEVMGLVFRMVHFKGDFWSVDPWMYHHATRIVRGGGKVRSAIDGFDFEVIANSEVIKHGPSGRRIPARIFHYGYARKAAALREKRRYQIRRHEGERLSEESIDRWAEEDAQFLDYGILKNFRGTHPRAMQALVNNAVKLKPYRNRWFNPAFYRRVLAQGFRG
ncbi:MAG: hypothetical protein U0172_13950 [Nitrospiraceae bacterium]